MVKKSVDFVGFVNDRLPLVLADTKDIVLSPQGLKIFIGDY